MNNDKDYLMWIKHPDLGTLVMPKSAWDEINRFIEEQYVKHQITSNRSSNKRAKRIAK